jgi:2-oxoglutarate ferredoxin oxidoreductase subunit gamma
MTEEIIFAGFGGQGVLSMGQVLAYSAVMEGQEVSWMPSYGPEMRGGTANCIVIISDEMISSPILNQFDTVVALNQPSVDKFEGCVKPGGTMIYDTNGITRHPSRSDINIYKIDAANESARMNNTKVMNMIILGGFLKLKPLIKMENITKGLKKVLPERYHNLVPLNLEAIEKGAGIIEKV